MGKWLTIIALVVAMSGSVIAGIPLHSEQGCGEMDCCATAHKQDDAPEVASARLCCALNCQQPGTATPNAATRLSQLAVALQPCIVQPIKIAPASLLRFHQTQVHQPNSQPSYIRHLALLI